MCVSFGQLYANMVKATILLCSPQVYSINQYTIIINRNPDFMANVMHVTTIYFNH